MLLFMKIGLYGGFTTFSLETGNLLEKQKYAQRTCYTLPSVILCLAEVILGKRIISILTHEKGEQSTSSCLFTFYNCS